MKEVLSEIGKTTANVLVKIGGGILIGFISSLFFNEADSFIALIFGFIAMFFIPNVFNVRTGNNNFDIIEELNDTNVIMSGTPTEKAMYYELKKHNKDDK